MGRAAQALHLAQPTVSTQLKELASALGLVLFEPRGRGLAPTAVGERLAQAMRDMGAAWQAFEDDAASLQGLRRGRLRIAAVTTTEYFLPDLLGPFARQYPGIEIELAVENRDAVVARLERADRTSPRGPSCRRRWSHVCAGGSKAPRSLRRSMNWRPMRP